jgi:hypothetical protein
VPSDSPPDIRLAVALPFLRLALLLTGVAFIGGSAALGTALIYVGLLSWGASVAIGAVAFRSSGGRTRLLEQRRLRPQPENVTPARS